MNLNPHSRNLDLDLAQCTYKAEKAVPKTTHRINIVINSKISKKERKSKESRHRQQDMQEKFDRDSRVRELRDLCLKARGWRWKYVDNK